MTTQSSAFKSQSLNFVVETSVHLATALPTASSVLPPPEVWGDRVHPHGNMALPTMVLLPTMGILPTNYGFTMVYWQSHQKLFFSSRTIHESLLELLLQVQIWILPAPCSEQLKSSKKFQLNSFATWKKKGMWLRNLKDINSPTEQWISNHLTT